MVERQRNGEIGKCLWNACATRLAMGKRAAAGFHQERIDMAVVATVELDDLLATGEPARKPDAGHRCFRPAVYHPHFLDRRHPGADQFRELDFEWVRNSEAQSARPGVAHRINNRSRRMTQDRKSTRLNSS